MANPFREGNLVERERINELKTHIAEIDARVAKEHARRWDIRRRTSPIFWSIFSRGSIGMAIAALLVGIVLNIAFDDAWVLEVCRRIP